MFDDVPVKKESGFKVLESMSVDEIEEYIAELRAEIERSEVDIVKKKASAAAADSVFK